jgi:hypothetical protein
MEGALMPVEAKPLFGPDVVRRHLKKFLLPPHVEQLRPELAKRAAMLASSEASAFKETELLPEFLDFFFYKLLGYRGPSEGAARYTISREKHVSIDNKFADAVIGDLCPGSERYIIALEGKGPKDPLERPHAGRRLSAVEQGYRYAINLPCDWIIATSMRQTRLYFKGADQHTYERFDVDALGADENALRRFVFLLGAERVTPEAGKCHLYGLLEETEKAGRELTRDFYNLYADMRRKAFDHLCRDNPSVPPPVLLHHTQTLLDRVLFCAFCEDRDLLPAESLARAYSHADPYNPRPIWDNFRGLFKAINAGNEKLKIPPYNGGLFADDPDLDALKVSDEVCGYFRELGDFDYRPAHEAAQAIEGGALVDVDILGHIFEQSISDLERLRDELESAPQPATSKAKTTRRKKEGAYYTPPFITRYIVDQALGGVLAERFERLRRSQEQSAKGTARTALADPRVYELPKLKQPQKNALVAFWDAWQEELATVRLVDPACGSGAFLIEAFDHLYATYQETNERLEELRGYRSLLDVDRRILQSNLYGVDLNAEAVEICRLSLWIKTAAYGKQLTSLDHNIREGNSIVSDPAVHPKAFEWQAAFPEVFAKGGFDVVVGNPPYVRQELLSPYKAYLESAYQAYHGMADLYVYFYELGLRVLKPGGLLSFIVTNKWMKAGYGEPLRRFFRDQAWVQSVVDFGHAKQIFEDADVFPSIIVARKPDERPEPTSARLCAIPRDQLRIDDLSRQIEEEGAELELSQLGNEAWQLEPDAISKLFEKIRSQGQPLVEFARNKPFRGVVTGCNEAFLIDSAAKDKLVREDPNCEQIIKPFLRGQDIDRWLSDWVGTWMIFARRGIDIEAYPSVKKRLLDYRERLEPKPADWSGNIWHGRKPGTYQWYEIQDSIDYWREFEKPKIVYQEIQFHPSYSFDTQGRFGNNKTFFIVSDDLYLLAVLNSPLMWWHNWRFLPHMKDEALSPVAFKMESLPIAEPDAVSRATVERSVRSLVEITGRQAGVRRIILDWLRIEYELDKPGNRLSSPIDLSSDEFVAEVKKRRGKQNPLSAAALKNLRDEYTNTIEPARTLAVEAMALERQVSDLVNAAYGLTPEEIDLMWKTAPPRMPLPPPTNV